MDHVRAITGSDLDTILSDIDGLYRAGFYYAAVHIALSVPDICSSLETKEDARLRFKIYDRYIAWCEQYLAHRFRNFTAEDCWALRGGVVHNGRLFGHAKARYDRILLQPPGTIQFTEMLSVNNGGTTESALMLSVKSFCENMLSAAQDWHVLKGTDETVKENMAGLVRLRPKGIFPHIVGSPVIA